MRRSGHQEARTVEEIRENSAAETQYSIQLGLDFATRVWAKESELQSATYVIHLCISGKEFQALPNVAEKEGVPRPGAKETIDTGKDKWKVIGVRKGSSVTDHFVDVEGT